MSTVIATYRTLPEAADAVADVLVRHAAASVQEPGCRQFLAHRALDDPTRFFLYEVYESEDAFAAHRRSEHFRENIERTLAPLLIEREWHACSEPLGTTRA
jgi:quinol monooxygenase YgiN